MSLSLTSEVAVHSHRHLTLYMIVWICSCTVCFWLLKPHQAVEHLICCWIDLNCPVSAHQNLKAFYLLLWFSMLPRFYDVTGFISMSFAENYDVCISNTFSILRDWYLGF